ncbi:acid phosphatase/Vanadium-dependent haloperoxidase [Trametopsis cervina]|nr:acid phosphatase/Vanadium-dependent haloperoxidase [Trametopsis cervina]
MGLDKQTRILVLSYATDWLISIALAAGTFGLDHVAGFKREFSLQDRTIQFPFAEHERVPDWALYVIAVGAPVVLLPLINSLTLRSKWDFHVSLLGLIFGLSLTGVVTEVVKLTVGRPRPDLIARCIPRSGSVDPPLGLSTFEICTQTDWYKFHDGWRSFPSGHSSLSFAGLGFLTFYLAGKLHLFDRKAYTVKVWLSLAPLLGAALVAISRTMDSRHHWQDVLTGSALGLTLSYLAYRQHYPALHSSTCHLPYPPRERLEQTVLPVHRNDVHPSLEMYRHASPSFDQPVYRDEHSDDEQLPLTSPNGSRVHSSSAVPKGAPGLEL